MHAERTVGFGTFIYRFQDVYRLWVWSARTFPMALVEETQPRSQRRLTVSVSLSFFLSTRCFVAIDLVETDSGSDTRQICSVSSDVFVTFF